MRRHVSVPSARAFVAASSQRFSAFTRAREWAEPLTIGVWAYRGTGLTNSCSISLGAAAGSDRWHLGIDSLQRCVALAADVTNTLGVASQSAATAALTWRLNAGVYRTSSDRSCFENNTEATNATAITVNSAVVDTLRISARYVTSEGFYWNGRLALPFVYDAALDAEEIRALAAGAHPLTVRRRNLVHLFNLNGRERTPRCLLTGIQLTPSASVPAFASSPRQFRPPQDTLAMLAATQQAGAAFVPAWARNANTIIGIAA